MYLKKHALELPTKPVRVIGQIVARRMTRYLRWKRQWGGSDRIVWVNVAKLDAAWKWDSSYYLAPNVIDAKHERFDRWLAENAMTERIEIPHISVYQGIASFTDGRHRFSWFRDHGVRAMPVTVSGKKQVVEVTRLAGSRARRCVLALSAKRSLR